MRRLADEILCNPRHVRGRNRREYLKTAQGFGEQFVFHSLRKTVASMLKDASVPEATAADILGHEIATMSYGLYVGSVSLETKAEAIAKLAY
jgi:integrase